ncbi:hypothetical protein QWZ13_11655 [Reinekea marina]|uniref:hypothetical protein n=1 Tax=Reinekea marina TaxID=1310421 RepID=UPI0025B38A5F|nr:hypothetical protein [Reinekea marina]MDN3649571.1 hypothetical protein [Reinekea marina]
MPLICQPQNLVASNSFAFFQKVLLLKCKIKYQLSQLKKAFSFCTITLYTVASVSESSAVGTILLYLVNVH